MSENDVPFGGNSWYPNVPSANTYFKQKVLSSKLLIFLTRGLFYITKI
jgi:hypothetical protein